MCFSASASFVIAAGCGISGAYCLSRLPSKRFLLLAAMHLAFGVQQAAEGLVWLDLEQGQTGVATGLPAYLFLAMAKVFWPAYVPYAIGRAERGAGFRGTFKVLLALGLCVAAVNAVKLTGSAVSARQLGHSLVYELCAAGPVPPVDWAVFQTMLAKDWILIPYAMATIGSLLMSSHMPIRVYGAFLACSVAVLLLFDSVHLVSVWCFIAAASGALSVYLTLDLRAQARGVDEGQGRTSRSGIT